MHDLQVKFHQLKPKFYPSRQRFPLPLKAGEKKGTSLAHGKKLSDYDIKDGSVLIFKDLGPQVDPSSCVQGASSVQVFTLKLLVHHLWGAGPLNTMLCIADWLLNRVFLGVLGSSGRICSILLFPISVLPHLQVSCFRHLSKCCSSNCLCLEM